MKIDIGHCSEHRRKWWLVVLLLLLSYSTYIQIDKSLSIRDMEKQIQHKDEKLKALTTAITNLTTEKDRLLERLQSSTNRYEEDRIRLLEAQNEQSKNISKTK